LRLGRDVRAKARQRHARAAPGPPRRPAPSRRRVASRRRARHASRPPGPALPAELEPLREGDLVLDRPSRRPVARPGGAGQLGFEASGTDALPDEPSPLGPPPPPCARRRSARAPARRPRRA
jgi:hypothetical protein